jgi:putative flippase GtrA
VSFFQELYYNLHHIAAKRLPRFYSFLFLHKKIFKYIFSGGTAAVVNLSVLFILTDFLGFWYLFSTTIAYVSAFAVSFCFQKFWTFKDMSVEKIHSQITLYLIIGFINLGVNAGLMYILVDWIKVWYFLAQIFVSGSIAVFTFFLYRNLIFKVRKK